MYKSVSSSIILLFCVSGLAVGKSIHKRGIRDGFTDQMSGLLGGQNPASGFTSQFGSLPLSPDNAISSFTGGQSGGESSANPEGSSSNVKASFTDQLSGFASPSGFSNQLGSLPMNQSNLTSQFGNVPFNQSSFTDQLGSLPIGGGSSSSSSSATETKAGWTDQVSGLMGGGGGGENPASGLTSQFGSLPLSPDNAISSFTGGQSGGGGSAAEGSST